MKLSNLKRLRLPWMLLAAVILVGLGTFLGLRKSVTLVLNGHASTHTTYAFRVGDLLYVLDIPLSPSDDLSPAQSSWLAHGATVTLTRSIPVQVFLDGEIISFTSTSRLPSAMLAEAGVTIQPSDLVLSNGQPVDITQPFPADSASISLQVFPAVSFSLTENSQRRTFTSTSPNLGAALWSAGYSLFTVDELDPPIETPLTAGMTASLLRSRPVTIRTQHENLVVRTSAQTVAGALVDANLTVQGLDYSLPDPSSPIPASGVVQVVRVSEDVLVEQAPLEFETQHQPVNDLALDSQSIVQAGEYGLTARRVRVRYEDGVEISRQVEDEWVAREPQPRILGYGTLVTLQTEVVDGVTIDYWRKIEMYATSYHPSGVGKTTASGLPLQKGVAAIDRNYIPFFTRMYVPGYGEVIAADIGGGVIGRWIDLGYSDDDYVPWHQWVTVYFLWPPPENIVWIIP
jgi:resuscitation-promoting factor RpfB